MSDNEQILETLKTTASTIGTQILTIKIYEYDGKLEESQRLKEQNQQLENQLERMVKLYRSMNKTV
jgi:hypothetical protein